jgi:hypothetical protein
MTSPTTNVPGLEPLGRDLNTAAVIHEKEVPQDE